MLHKDPIEVGAVDAGVAGGVRNADRIGIIIFQVFFCFCKILQRGLGIRFRGCFLHERKKKQKNKWLAIVIQMKVVTNHQMKRIAIKFGVMVWDILDIM